MSGKVNHPGQFSTRTTASKWSIFSARQHHKELVTECRYYADQWNSVIVDRTKDMRRKESRITETANPLVKKQESFFNNVDDYIANGRMIYAHVDHVIDSIEQVEKRLPYISRLLAALTTLSGVRFDSEVDSTVTRTPIIADKYRKLGRYVLNKWVNPAQQQGVLADYRTIIEDESSPN
jgi:hypothetical protein